MCALDVNLPPAYDTCCLAMRAWFIERGGGAGASSPSPDLSGRMPLTAKPTDDCVCRRGEDIESVLRELTAVRTDMVAEPALPQQRLDDVHANYRDSARNLLHYLALRRHDLRPLQLRLAALGLSSLGRAESHVLATVDAVLEVLHRLAGRDWQPPVPEGRVDFADGQRLLAGHTDALLGPA